MRRQIIYGRATLRISEEGFAAELRQDAGCENPYLSRQEAILGASSRDRLYSAEKAVKAVIEAVSQDDGGYLRCKREAVNDLYGLLIAVGSKARLGGL